MSSPYYGQGKDNTASVRGLYRHLLTGRYLESFDEQADGLNYYEMMTLGQGLFEMQKYTPDPEPDDCDCNGAHDAPACPRCAEAAGNQSIEEIF